MNKGALRFIIKAHLGAVNTGKYFIMLMCLLTASNLLSAKNITVSFTPDTIRVLRNPLNGWIMYLGRTWDSDFWEEQGYDNMPAGALSVRVSDFASTCYVRTSWSSMEPEEGKYFWEDKSSRLYKLFQSIRARRMKLAFRIVVDSRDQGQNTPLFVKEAGAQGFLDSNNSKLWSPYPDDPVFQQKYANFIRALAEEYNNPDVVDFIDAYGLGKWGEAHGVRYQDYRHKKAVFDWITDLYSQSFTRIPLAINYHRLVGDTISWADPHPESEMLLEEAIGKGYSLRHDAFGMTGYYQQWEQDFVRKWNFRRPVIMEGGWITGGHHRYWIDPSGAYRQGHSEDVRREEYQEARNAHVNMMDFRVGDETHSWFASAFDLVKAFVKEGGYRLYPSQVIVPDRAKKNQSLTLSSVWNNLGWGYCPTNIPQWNQKYKVAYALAKGQSICKVFVDDKSDLSEWLKGKPTKCSTTIMLPDLAPGKYQWLTALVDTTQGNTPGLEVALPSEKTSRGWVKVSTLKIR